MLTAILTSSSILMSFSPFAFIELESLDDFIFDLWLAAFDRDMITLNTHRENLNTHRETINVEKIIATYTSHSETNAFMLKHTIGFKVEIKKRHVIVVLSDVSTNFIFRHSIK